MSTSKITDRQKKFADEYLICFNAKQAAIIAGYSPKTAQEQASRLLSNVKVQEYLQQEKEKLQTKTDITKERIIAEYAKIAFFDIRKIYTVDGGLKSIHDIDDDSAAAIAGIESQDLVVEEMTVGKTNKIKVADKRSALDSLCKVLGFNAPEKVTNEIDFTNIPIVFK